MKDPNVRNDGLLVALSRRKLIKDSDLEKSNLARCMNLFDLLALGIGSTLGAGLYVLTGQVARELTGPSVIFSFLIAAVASIFAGFCYAEFGSRVPRSGSAYIYSYVTVGEIWAFIIGYSLMLEYMIGSASIARAWSATLDSMVDRAIATTLQHHLPINLPMLSSYPDLVALAVILIVTVILSIGVNCSSRITNILASANIFVVCFVIVCGCIKGNIENWKINPQKVPDFNTSTFDANRYGNGGFFPFGISGILAGAATCFFAFAGFDSIASTGEEVKNPQKLIPIGIIGSLFVSFLAYIGVSMALTLMVPFYQLDPITPIPMAFVYVGWSKLKFVIAVGSMCALSTSLMGCMFPQPRIMYAMGLDGLIFRFLSIVNPKTHMPIYATIVAGLLAGTMATFFDLKELIDLMSIGTLLSYTLVAACVLILRYRPTKADISYDYSESNLMPYVQSDGSNTLCSNYTLKETKPHDKGISEILKHILIPKYKRRVATDFTANIALYFIWAKCILIVIFCLIFVITEKSVISLNPVPIAFLSIIALAIALCLYIIAIQPQDNTKLNFKVPLVPLIPFISIFVNIFLMMKMSKNTWIQYAVFMVIGFLIYFLYGIRNSSQKGQTIKENCPGKKVPTITLNGYPVAHHRTSINTIDQFDKTKL